MMKYFLIFLLLFVSCSEKKSDETLTNAQGETQEVVDVKIAFKRIFPSKKRAMDYTAVNPSLAKEIAEVLKGEGKEIKAVPKLTPTILLVDEKEYKLYPHTILDLAENKQYHFEDIYKKVYTDWMKYIVVEEEKEKAEGSN